MSEPAFHRPGGDEPFDLDARACLRCRRPLQPFEDDCPECHEPGTLRFTALAAGGLAAPPAHLLPDADAGHGTVAAPAGGAEAPAADLDLHELPQPPPADADPLLG